MSARTTRRSLVGGSAATAVLMGSASTSKAGEVDGRLIELTTEIAQIDAATAVLNASPDPIDWDELSQLQNQFWHLADQVLQERAHTPEGMQAKARVLRSVHQGIAGSEMDPVSLHMHSLVRDMLGEA